MRESNKTKVPAKATEFAQNLSISTSESHRITFDNGSKSNASIPGPTKPERPIISFAINTETKQDKVLIYCLEI
jgi:hypothetical protein